jgi:recombination protein RecT
MTAQTTSQALVALNEGPGAVIEAHRKSFALVLPSHLTPEHWVRLAQGVLRRDQKLSAVAQKNPGSFLSALLDCARLGLEPGDTYHLVPFGSEVQGIVDYTGEIELIYRAGAVSTVTAEVVYQNDVFEFQLGEMDRPRHTPPVNPTTGKPDWFTTPRGPMVGAYGYAVLKDGAVSRVPIMDREQLAQIQAISKNQNLWKQWPDRMWRKTIVHQLAKWVPSSAEYRQQVLAVESKAAQAASDMHVQLPSPDYGPDLPPPNDNEVVVGEIVDDGRPFE